MSKKLIAIILAVVVLLSAIGVGIFFIFKNKEVDDVSYEAVELSAGDIHFNQNSNKPNIELILDEDLFTKAFGKKATFFSYNRASRIRINFSEGDKFEIKPEKDTVKTEKDNGIVKIKIYTNEKEIFENVNKTIRFDMACSVKIFFDEGTFNIDDGVSKAVTFVLKCDNKIVSDVQEAYLRASYENLVLNFTLTDAEGKEIYFTSSGHTKENVIVFTDKANKHNFNSTIVTTDLFKTAVLNPSETFASDKTIYICIPDGFFVNSQGNRIKIIGIKNSGKNIRLATLEDMTETTTANTETTTDAERTTVTLSASDGVYTNTTFENEFTTATGMIIRNLTDVEVVIPTNSDWGEPVFSGRIITSTDTYELPTTAIVGMKAVTINGYVAYVSVKDAQTCDMGGVEMNGILFEEDKIYDIELTVTDAEGNLIANVTAPVEK